MSTSTSGQLLVSNGTIIDGTSSRPIESGSVLVAGETIKAVGRSGDFADIESAEVIDARGKYVIPGLLNANVHLLGDARLETLTRYLGRYQELIEEAAQVALKSGLTTVFDTWGPREMLQAVQRRINSGRVPGSRIYIGGNIIGFEGPLSGDFYGKAAEVASTAMVKRINAIWVQNVGRNLMWLAPEELARELRTYIRTGVDFIKFASNEHGAHSAGAFLSFTKRAQKVMVEEAHHANMTAQAHTMSVEGLRTAVEAGCDLIQHANITGPTPIPSATLELLQMRKTGVVLFPWRRRALEWIMKNGSDIDRVMWGASDENVKNIVGSGAMVLLGNDGIVFSPEALTDPVFGRTWGAVAESDSLSMLGTGHFAWFEAMEEKGCPPMEMLWAATRNIAKAYGKLDELGTIEGGKRADLVILNRDPLKAAENYRSIHMVIKDGKIVDRTNLPLKPILTQAVEIVSETATHLTDSSLISGLPMCWLHRGCK